MYSNVFTAGMPVYIFVYLYVCLLYYEVEEVKVTVYLLYLKGKHFAKCQNHSVDYDRVGPRVLFDYRLFNDKFAWMEKLIYREVILLNI